MLTIYLDTSVLLKRYLKEARAEETRQFLEEADEIATGVITRVEIASALARLAFLSSITAEEAEKIWTEFSDDWTIITRLQVISEVIERTASLARQYRLRGYDAVHLASALLWKEKMSLPVTLATFDRELWMAGKKSSMDMWPEDLDV
ncbi:MAG: type II toxin-antitoxin system VapC family toxin [Chloroflexota bacterium]